MTTALKHSAPHLCNLRRLIGIGCVLAGAVILSNLYLDFLVQDYNKDVPLLVAPVTLALLGPIWLRQNWARRIWVVLFTLLLPFIPFSILLRMKLEPLYSTPHTTLSSIQACVDLALLVFGMVFTGSLLMSRYRALFTVAPPNGYRQVFLGMASACALALGLLILAFVKISIEPTNDGRPSVSFRFEIPRPLLHFLIRPLDRKITGINFPHWGRFIGVMPDLSAENPHLAIFEDPKTTTIIWLFITDREQNIPLNEMMQSVFLRGLPHTASRIPSFQAPWEEVIRQQPLLLKKHTIEADIIRVPAGGGRSASGIRVRLYKPPSILLILGFAHNGSVNDVSFTEFLNQLVESNKW